MAKQVKDFSTEERQHILKQLVEGELTFQEVARVNDTSWQTIRAIQRIAEGNTGQRKTTPEERERILKRAVEVGFAQAAAENHLSESSILNWQWRYKMNMPDRSDTENRKKPAYNKVYTPEEKADILAFAREAGVVDAAKKFNVSTTSIRNWTKQAEQKSMIHLVEKEQPEDQTVQSPVQPQVQEQVQEQAQPLSAQTSANEEIAMEQNDVFEVRGQSDPIIEALLPADSTMRALAARVQELNIEVAILKEKNDVLTRRIEALKASLATLIQ